MTFIAFFLLQKAKLIDFEFSLFRIGTDWSVPCIFYFFHIAAKVKSLFSLRIVIEGDHDFRLG